MSYLTIELKTNDEGGTSADLLYTGSDRRVAEQKYHQVLMNAATSGRRCHGAIVLKEDGTPIEYASYSNEGE